MQTLTELVRDETDLTPVEVEQLDRLLSSWQLLADLSFADLLLWCPLKGGSGFVCLAQMRPYTTQTLYPNDLVGKMLRPEELAVVDRVYAQNHSWRSEEPLIIDGSPIRIEAIPVPSGDQRVIAIMTIHSAPLKNRRRGELEQNYLECAAVLARMVGQGVFPFPGEALDPELAPRVGDGMIRLNLLGKVMYASPNAVSAFRRLGVVKNLQGEKLADIGVDAAAATQALTTGIPAQIDVEVGASVMLQRALPFLEGRDRRVTGALVLVRDVTQLRYRERQLKRQQAVIREVHHRVKNNLQTIASLLRLQGRRVPPEAQRELQEATRRIAAIALVHETLSKESGQYVDFAGVAGRLIRMVSEGLLHPDARIELRLNGDPGKLHSDLATPLAVVLVELIQNAVEHAFGDAGGTVNVLMKREGDLLTMTVTDDGKGLPPGFAQGKKGLGLKIVSALVESELAGKFSYESESGARFCVAVPTNRVSGAMPSLGD